MAEKPKIKLSELKDIYEIEDDSITLGVDEKGVVKVTKSEYKTWEETMEEHDAKIEEQME